MKVCVTEKPSVARDIARLLGASDKRDGYFEGNGYQVTWTFGHLCELKAPNDYTDQWKRWSLGQLPMIPQRFGIKLKDDDGIKRQFNVIKHLIASADEVINCGVNGMTIPRDVLWRRAAFSSMRNRRILPSGQRKAFWPSKASCP